jgi:hypothetical protein
MVFKRGLVFNGWVGRGQKWRITTRKHNVSCVILVFQNAISVSPADKYAISGLRFPDRRACTAFAPTSSPYKVPFRRQFYTGVICRETQTHSRERARDPTGLLRCDSNASTAPAWAGRRHGSRSGESAARGRDQCELRTSAGACPLGAFFPFVATFSVAFGSELFLWSLAGSALHRP